jgi:hypothetical protein
MRVSYRAAIAWIAANDDTEWLQDAEPIPSVTASMVADLFGKSSHQVEADLRRAVAKKGGR